MTGGGQGMQTGMHMEQQPISILIVDDHPFLRFGINICLGPQSRLRVVGEISNLANARAWFHQGNRADVVILDRGLPDGDGLELMPLLKASGAKVLVLTIEDDGTEIRAALNSGVDGYLLKDTTCEDLIRSLYIVLKQARAIPLAVLERLSEVDLDRAFELLTPRELEVAELVAQGMSNKMIGVRFSLSENTVRNHLSNAMAKLNLHNRVQLATLMMQYPPRFRR